MDTQQRTNASEPHRPVFPYLPAQHIEVTLQIILWVLGTFTGTRIFFLSGPEARFSASVNLRMLMGQNQLKPD